jgi:hypothetical protein
MNWSRSQRTLTVYSRYWHEGEVPLHVPSPLQVEVICACVLASSKKYPDLHRNVELSPGPFPVTSVTNPLVIVWECILIGHSGTVMETGYEINWENVTVYRKTQPKLFFRCQCLCVLLIYITCRIFCAKGITVSQIFCELLHFDMLVLENLEKSDF